jgi:hypothetical protein
MGRPVIAILGLLDIDRAVFDHAAGEFGWSVEYSPDLLTLRQKTISTDVLAVVFNAPTLEVSWREALEAVLRSAPRALPIVGAAFSETVPSDELAEAGAFHELRLPIDPGEVRRTLGFIWAAKRAPNIDDAEPAPGQRVNARSALTARVRAA